MATPDADLLYASAAEQARSIRDRDVSSLELVDAHLARIERYNPRINAVVTLDAESARRTAAAADEALGREEIRGPLHGVPVTIKDLYATAGMRTTFATPLFSRYVPDEDATLVARMRSAGAIVLGKTNVPLLAYDWQCRNPIFGRTVNPWDPDRTPGGSSGGSAASLAAGFSALELGNDVAGSIRVPCHFCGVAGLRPTEGRLSSVGSNSAPGYPRALRNFIACGPMARHVEDLQAVLPVLDGPDPRDWRVGTAPPEPSLAGLSGLRVAWSVSLGGVPVDRDTREALHGLLRELEQCGCLLEEAVPEGFSFEEALDVWGRIQGYELAGHLPFPFGSRLLRLPVRSGLLRLRFGGRGFGRGLERGLTASPYGYFRALTRRDELVRVLDGFLRRFDLWITPTTSTPAFTHRRTGTPIEVDDTRVPYSQAMGMFNCPTALTAHPILVLPVGRSAAGLPIGVQIHARRWRDATLLAAGRLIEARVGSSPRPPGLV